MAEHSAGFRIYANATEFERGRAQVTRTAGAPGAQFSQTLNLNPGTTCVRAFVSNTYGVESAPSNVSSRVVDPPTPRPPQLTAIEPQVFDVRPNETTFAFDRGRQVGTVKIGAACDEDRTTGEQFYALERPSQVKLSRQPRSQALVVRCGEKASRSRAQTTAKSQPNVSFDYGSRVLVGAGVHSAA